MNAGLTRWLPVLILSLGACAMMGNARHQRPMSLRHPLAATLPLRVENLEGRDTSFPPEEERVAGMSSYVLREFRPGDGGPPASVYVGYYEDQVQGRTIHSPKNCLPGAGWVPLEESTVSIAAPEGQRVVNRYLLQNGQMRVLVLYWYQGRGRVTAGEYSVKWNLLRDKVLRGRSDEALVRVVVPVTGAVRDAERTAVGIAREVIPAVFTALPS